LILFQDFYIGGVPTDVDPADQPSNCRFCLTHKDLISINEPLQSKDSSKTIAEWLMFFCPTVKIATTDKLSQKVCMDCKIEVLYAINLRVRAEDSNGALKKMLQDCDNSIEMVPMCRICMDDTDLQPIEELKSDIEMITGFKIELDNGLPNYICTVDQGKIKATVDFLEKVHQVEVIQRRVLLSGQSVSTLFPVLPTVSLKEEEDEKEDLEEPSEQDGEIIEILDSDEEELVKSQEFGCKKCDERFDNVTALNDHKKSAHYVAVQRQCDICAEILPDAYKFRLHTLTEHYQGDEIYECTTCQHTFKHQFLLDDHVKRCQMVQAINQKNPLKVWSCQYCRFKTFLETLYREHLLIHSDKYQCHHCERYFPLKRHLLKHFTAKVSNYN
jgi:Zinc-finger associated domain (zf-AD)